MNQINLDKRKIKFCFDFIRQIIIITIMLSLLYPPIFSAIKQGTLEFLSGGYQIDDPRFKAIYQEKGPIHGLSLSANLFNPLNFYLEIRYFQRQGSLTYTKEKTQFHLLPLSLGLRAMRPLKILIPFVGVGADFYTYYEDNPIGTVLNFTNGYHLVAGLYLQAGKLPFFLSARLKYSRATAEEEKGRRIQLGGFESALGFGFIF